MVVSALLLLLAAVPTSSVSARLPPLAIGETMPAWRQPVQNAARFGAESVDLRDFWAGGPRAQERPFVTFAASWCQPCLAELRALSAARAALEAARTRVIVVVADDDVAGRAKLVRHLVEELDVPFAVVVDELGILRRRYRAEQLPASFVADTAGRLVWATSGYDEATSAALLGLLTTRR